MLLYACARLGAMLVPLNWRLAVAEQSFILSDASVKVLVLEQAFADDSASRCESLIRHCVVGLDFSPPQGRAIDQLLARRARRRPQSAYRSHLPVADRLHLGHDRKAQGRGAAAGSLLLERRDERSAHAWPHLGRPRTHRAAFLPRRRPQHSDHAGAAPRRHGDDPSALHPGRDAARRSRANRPTLTVLVPAIIQAVTDHPDWATTDLSSLKAVSTGSTIVPPHPDRTLRRARGAGAAGLRFDRTCPIAVYTRLGGDLSRAASTGLAGLCCEAAVIDDAGVELPRGHAQGNRGARAQRILTNIGVTRKRPGKRCTTAGIAPATSACARRRRLFLASTTARRT